MRVPTRSLGIRSGVNWIRLNVPPSTWAVVLIVSVFARPGTPSIRRCPPASRQTSTRSSMASCPAITRLISKRACSSSSRCSATLVSLTARSLLAVSLRVKQGGGKAWIKRPLRSGAADPVGEEGLRDPVRARPLTLDDLLGGEPVERLLDGGRRGQAVSAPVLLT